MTASQPQDRRGTGDEQAGRAEQEPARGAPARPPSCQCTAR